MLVEDGGEEDEDEDEDELPDEEEDEEGGDDEEGGEDEEGGDEVDGGGAVKFVTTSALLVFMGAALTKASAIKERMAKRRMVLLIG